MGNSSKKSIEIIRDVLLKRVSKRTNVYAYCLAIQEARELLGFSRISNNSFSCEKTGLKLLAEC